MMVSPIYQETYHVKVCTSRAKIKVVVMVSPSNLEDALPFQILLVAELNTG